MGSYRAKYVNIFNDPRVALPGPHYLALLDMNPHVNFIRKYGENNAVADGTYEEIWSYGGSYNWLASASTLYLSSSGVADAQAITVQGLDANYEYQSVEVNLSGVTFVPLPGTWTRVFRAFNSDTTEFAGVVYISSNNTDAGADGIPDVTTAIHATIPVDDQQTQMAIYTVPAGRVAVLRRWQCSVHPVSGGTAKLAEFRLCTREIGTSVFRIKDQIGLQTTGTGAITLPLFDSFTGPYDIMVQAAGVGAAVDCTATFWVEEFNDS